MAIVGVVCIALVIANQAIIAILVLFWLAICRLYATKENYCYITGCMSFRPRDLYGSRLCAAYFSLVITFRLFSDTSREVNTQKHV